jgi:hypothetical protein
MIIDNNPHQQDATDMVDNEDTSGRFSLLVRSSGGVFILLSWVLLALLRLVMTFEYSGASRQVLRLLPDEKGGAGTSR